MKSKLGEGAKLAEALVDFGAIQRTETFDAELFATEAPHDRAVDDGAAQLAGIDVTVLQIETFFGQVADKAAGEAVARARGIEDFFEQVARDDEVGSAMEQDR